MPKKIFYSLLFALSIVSTSAFAQTNHQRKHVTSNIIIITIDGFRWQEVFRGADSALLFNNNFVKSDSALLVKNFWDNHPQSRRKKLLPFIWNVIAQRGQIYGNRDLGNFVNVKNPYWFSYPGYNEIFTGYADTAINSNSYGPNPNITVLDFINKQKKYHHKVASFASWEAFPRILNRPRADYLINAGFESYQGDIMSESQKVINQMQYNVARYFGGERLDVFTYFMARQYLKMQHPKVLHIGFGDTDDFAHEHRYDYYLQSAHYTDAMIEDLWNYLQSDKFYRDKTTLFICVDHGRGEGDQWTSHGSDVPHSNEIWFAVLGPDTPALGEIKTNEQLYQNQFARTIAKLIGLDFESGHAKEQGDVIKQIMDYK